MANQRAPSSSFSSTPSWEYDVFLSFRGKDTRTNFTSHLYRALVRDGIRTFLDDSELPKGEEISPTLLKAIENSGISVIVFSENYASSRWCLDELVHILECRKSKRQMTRPIFYKVDPTDVRHQKNSFGVAFAVSSSKYENDPEKVQRWRTALTEAANLKGDTLDEKGVEATFIDRIVEEISIQVSNHTCLNVARYPVGIESCAKEVEELLGVGGNGRRVVGIWGTSGIGKTTIAKAVYNAIAHEFEGSCFLADASETSASHKGRILLQNALLSKILCGAKLSFVNADEGISLIKNRLRQKKVLLILDDVDKLERLKDWVDVDCFGEGSRVIITTKDRGLLESYGVQWIYEVQKLGYDKALELFSWNAFKSSRPPDAYSNLARRAIGYAHGLPLALNVIGSYLHNKSIGRWHAVLNSYDSFVGEPYTDIQIALRKTYDAWDYSLQQVFLDIACFFKGEHKDVVLQVLRSSTLIVRQDIIDVLVENAIIAIEDNRILMHGLLQKMGKHIVYEESPSEPGERSRLWHHEDVRIVITENRGTRKIRGIVVNLPEPDKIPLYPNSFSSMVNLEYFINRNAQFSGGVDYLPNSLRLFDWGGQSIIDIKHTVALNLPSNFRPRHLVKFNVSSGGIRQLKGFENLAKLTWMNLSGCEFLKKIPDLSGSPNLEHLDLSDCTSLVEVDDSVGFLDKLKNLRLGGCSMLTKFATRLGLRSLNHLSLRGCRRLESFPEIEGKMESLEYLEIGYSGIRELPSFACLPRLWKLQANGCKIIQHLGFGKTVKFDEVSSSYTMRVKLNGCDLSENDFSVPLGWCCRVTRLELKRNNFVSLPDCISELVNLMTLSLGGCNRLREIPVLPQKLQELHLDDCTSLEKFPKLPLTLRELDLSRNNFVSLPDCISEPVNLETLILRGCKRLREIPVLGNNFVSLPDCLISKRLREISVLPPKLIELYLNDCTSLEKIQKLPPRLKFLCLCNCLELSGDEVAKLANNWLNEELYPRTKLTIIYPGNEVPKWFSYISNHPTIIYPLPEDDREEELRGCEFHFEIPLKLQGGETLLGLALSFVLEPPTCYYEDYAELFLYINRKCICELNSGVVGHKETKATHVIIALMDLAVFDYEQPRDIWRAVFSWHHWRNGSPVKSCGVQCLLRNQDEPLHLSLRQQLLQRQDPMQFQGLNPQLQAMLQQQRLRQQQQILQSMPQLQRGQLQQQQQQQQQQQLQQLRQEQFQQPMQPASSIKRPYDGGVCARRLMQYLYHQRQRPADNNITYWRKFVTEYYSPHAMKSWCVSLYDNVWHRELDGLSRAPTVWGCDICGSESIGFFGMKNIFVAKFEELPRLNEIKFGSGVIDELLDLYLPRECIFPSGVMMLEYGKAVQGSVYDQPGVVREGQLRIIFTQDLKILSWEFCARRLEKLPPRRLVAPQVNQLVQVAQKCQSTIAESGSEVQDIAREFTENGFFNSNPDELLHWSLRPTSSLGKRPHPRGSSDIDDDEYDHPKRRQIDIEEEEEQEQPSASDDPQFQIS